TRASRCRSLRLLIAWRRIEEPYFGIHSEQHAVMVVALEEAVDRHHGEVQVRMNAPADAPGHVELAGVLGEEESRRELARQVEALEGIDDQIQVDAGLDADGIRA